MSRKAKFKPEITRVKLNPEQAVLSCDCYNTGYKEGGGAHWDVCVFVPTKGLSHESAASQATIS